MGTNRILMLLLVLGLSSNAFAGDISRMFSEDVFGVQWDSTLDDVQRVFPEGVSETEHGIVIYTIRDDRTILGVRRQPDNFIKFIFDAEGLSKGVHVQFPGEDTDNYLVLLHKLRAHFGEQAFLRNIFGTIRARWNPQKDIYIGLDFFPETATSRELLKFTVDYRPEVPGNAPKEMLGF